MSHLSQDHIQRLYQDFGDLKVLDDILRHRAADDIQLPILGYPRFEHSADDYELFDGKTLDRFVDSVAKRLIASGFEPDRRRTVALLAPSNVNFIVTFFAISRLGYTVFPLSLRITTAAIINLLRRTECTTIIHGETPQINSTLQQVAQDYPIDALKLPTRSEYDRAETGEEYFNRQHSRDEENGRIALIIHSSGSTGLPKPIFLTHKALLCHPTQGSGLHNFNALPWYHLYGISTSLQAMWMRKTAYLYNTALPLTADNLITVVEKVQPDAIHCVPYALGLLAERKQGVEILKTRKVVTAAGARTPDELGDRLVRDGVNLGVVFGTTEAGLAGDTMRRQKGDDTWNYIRLYANIRQYIAPKPLGDNLFEFVYLKGHPALSTSNSKDPPGSWHSKDVFTPHPQIPDIWKYVTRSDDRVTLINGEKVLPLPIEGRMREDPLVREAVVVGVDQSIPGLLVCRAPAADDMSDTAYLDAIWPSVADANSRSEAFSQISRDMIRLIPSNVEYPQTDKGSIIRTRFYDEFADKINQMYAQVDAIEERGNMKLNLPALEGWIMATFKDKIGVSLVSTEADFFSSGVDSLKAIHMRRLLLRNLDLGGKDLAANVVYEHGNPKELARYLSATSKGSETEEDDSLTLMTEMIEKYSHFNKHVYRNGFIYDRVSSSPEHSVILTGATGAIGAHTLAQLLHDSSVQKIYCLVRGPHPFQRILHSLHERRLHIPPSQQQKVIALDADLSKENFGLGDDPGLLSLMRIEVGLIIHIAWPVNFNIHLRSFEPHVRGLYNLLKFSLAVHRPQPARLMFCSSVSVAQDTPASSASLVPEAPILDFRHASRTGYARSKLVGEHVVWNAVQKAEAQSSVLRIGQVVGDTKEGIWNDKDFVPMIIRSALTMGTLPLLRERCSWIPVDILATSILELASLKINPSTPQIFYNILSPHTFSWDHSLLLRLQDLTIFPPFSAVPVSEWLKQLRESDSAKMQEKKNPAVKLAGYFEAVYGGVVKEEIEGGKAEEQEEEVNGEVNGEVDGKVHGKVNGKVNEKGSVEEKEKLERDRAIDESLKGKNLIFDTTAARRDSPALRRAPNILEGGLLESMVGEWMRRWAAVDRAADRENQPKETIGETGI